MIKVGDQVYLVQYPKKIGRVVEVANPYMFDYPVSVEMDGKVLMLKEDQLIKCID